MKPALRPGDCVEVTATRHPRDGQRGTVKSVKRLVAGDTWVTVEFHDSGAAYIGLARNLRRVALT